MTRDSDLIGLIEDYLDDVDGHTLLPDTTRDAIRARLPSTSQRPAWWPGWRFPEMNTTAKLAMGVAAAALVVLVGFTVMNGRTNVGGPAPASPTVAATPTASPEAATIVIGDGLLADVQVTSPRPEGWTLTANFASKAGSEPNGIGFSAWTSTAPHADPCHWQDEIMDPSTPPTVEEIVATLVGQPGRDPRPPVEATLGGWPATRLELVTPPALDIATCDLGRYKAWTDLADPNGGNWNHENGQLDVVYVVDVDGVTVVIDSWYGENTSLQDLGELETLFEAMVIDRQ